MKAARRKLLDESHPAPMPKPGIPVKLRTEEELLNHYGCEENLVEAYLLRQLPEDAYHVLSPTWMTNALLRRVLEKLDEAITVLRGEPTL